ncbi:hypothetical protein PFICI_12029 [Pestalotiopsis fici W106-1]|uniref:Uncharacterized protein n=1 Tax=Pestalotiopsis fici (strain W106-1 / CGMCC3.15140) TaxID=1229662 RepID=W3WU08_PESFW|nr:uncharacterized protein PFICI_12029 [Pestalotiopsis fici W106-1]ETS76642.1 hypothetical protein PFICI_12029 [Pestalotiopsis fici W106-1]
MSGQEDWNNHFRFDTTWVPRIPIVAMGKNVQEIIRAKQILYLSMAMPETWSGPCSSWFKNGAGGKLAMFPGSRITSFELMNSPRFEDYKIEYRDGNTFAFLGNGFSTTEFDGSDLSWYLGNEENPGCNLPGPLPT